MSEPLRDGMTTMEIETADSGTESSGPLPVLLPSELPWHARLGLSWSAGTMPIVSSLLLGAALGPSGLALFTPAVLAVIDPVIPVAVAALGILVGLEVTRPAVPYRGALLAKANLQSLVTGIVVAAGIWLIGSRVLDLGEPAARIVALVAGVCASMSGALPASDPDRLRPPITRVRDFDALLPTAVGATVLASLHSASALATVGLAVQAAILALVISATAWFLLVDTLPLTEQRVFSIAALLLVGGMADYLSLSALASGLLAGLFWGVVGGVARDCIERDVSYVRHPLVVLMLLTAGARATLSPSILALAAAYVLLRVVGKLAGGWFARRSAGRVWVPAYLGASLLPPSVFGIAFALDAVPMLGSSAPLMLASVVVGSVASQFVAAMWTLRGRE